MSEQKVEYAKNRFLNPAKVIEASVYPKQAKDANDKGEYPVVWRVAIKMDVANVENATLYSDPYQSEAEAVKFLQTLPF